MEVIPKTSACLTNCTAPQRVWTAKVDDKKEAANHVRHQHELYTHSAPIPPGELAELQKKLGLAPDGSVLPVAVSSAAAKDATPPYPKTSGVCPFHYWRWLAAGIVVVAVLLLFLKAARRL